MNQAFADRIKKEFKALTGIDLEATYMSAPHSPSTLQSGTCGVYVFMSGKHCFKVGKAGPKAKARWNSHHYNLDKKTPSTLPKTILKYREFFMSYFPSEVQNEISGLCKSNIQAWMKNRMSRIEFLVGSECDGFALNLLEALVQYRLRPVFEGRRKPVVCEQSQANR